MAEDSTERFGSRVEDYVKYRPRYPHAVLEFLQRELKLDRSSVVADIGSGTGILSELFLAAGYSVYGVEPNSSMRLAAEKNLAIYPAFQSVNGKAEETGMSNDSVDLIVVGQAFHWFDRVSCKREFRRILRAPGNVALLWNDRRQDSSFANAYENFLRVHAIDYDVVDHRLITPEVLKEFYGHPHFGFRMFENQQIFDLEGLQGRVTSCSYMPTRDHPDFEKMIRALSMLFERFENNGTVLMNYNTLVYYGRIE